MKNDWLDRLLLKLKKEKIEKIKRSCLNCGNEFLKWKPCCSDPYTVLIALKEDK
jgi:hypothetical protein